jgi:pilus assembly protein CpaE
VLTDGPGGIKVLLAPTSPELADLVTTAHLRALVGQLRSSFDYILLDSGSYLNEITLEGVDIADQIILLSDFSVPSIKNARLVLEVLGVLRVEPSRVTVVLNHRDAPPDLDPAHVQSLLKSPIGAEIPYDPSVVSASVSQGVPFILSHPESPASVGVRQLVARLAPPAAARGGRASGHNSRPEEKKKRPRRILGFARS